MKQTVLKKKTYSSPEVVVIGSLSDKTRTGWDWITKHKVAGPGDQFILTDPPTCWDGYFYTNCENQSA